MHVAYSLLPCNGSWPCCPHVHMVTAASKPPTGQHGRSPLAWEDVMLGLLLEDVADPQDHFSEPLTGLLLLRRRRLLQQQSRGLY